MRKKKNNKLEKTLDQLNTVRNGLYTSMAMMIKIRQFSSEIKNKIRKTSNR